MNNSVLNFNKYIKRLRFITLFISAILTLYGCANYYVKQENALNFTDRVGNLSGIVIGRVTSQAWHGVHGMLGKIDRRGIGFTNIETGKETVYVSAHYFFLRLPEGTYSFSGIGTTAGAFLPVDVPFKFTVKNGEIKYIGSFVADRDLVLHLNKIKTLRSIKDSDIIATRIYAVKDGAKVRFYIIDERDDVVSKFMEVHPEFADVDVKADFMK